MFRGCGNDWICKPMQDLLVQQLLQKQEGQFKELLQKEEIAASVTVAQSDPPAAAAKHHKLALAVVN